MGKLRDITNDPNKGIWINCKVVPIERASTTYYILSKQV
jgi:hypothetical protein